jgi:regulatory protein
VALPRRSKPDCATAPAPALTARALRLLARREHTRRELRRKLAAHAGDPAVLEALLDDLTRRGWLSDERFVEQFVHARRGRFGPARIRRALLERGVAEDEITRALAGLKDEELEAARAVWLRKFKAPPRTAEERARQVRFLQSRGFSVDVALRVVRSNGASDQSTAGE